MPPAVAAAGIGAASTLGGALIGRSGQNRAIGAQERATQAQIALERERDAARQRRYDAAMVDYRKEKDFYDQTRRQLLEHYYGIKQPAPAAPAPAPGGQGQGMAPVGGVTLGGLMSRPPVASGGPALGPSAVLGPPDPGQPSPDAEADVFDWRRYGVS